jgi:L-lactate utilization protein LutB
LLDGTCAGSAAGAGSAGAAGSGVAAGSSDAEAAASPGIAGTASGACSDDCAVDLPLAAGVTATLAPSATGGDSELGRGGSNLKGST